MMKIFYTLLILQLSFQTMAEDIPCWLNPEKMPEIKQTAILKTYLHAINLDSPEDDLKIRVSHNDMRFIAIGGFGMTYPGLTRKELLCIHGFRYINGTTDALESSEHAKLIKAFKSYAKVYNSKLERMVNGS